MHFYFPFRLRLITLMPVNWKERQGVFSKESTLAQLDILFGRIASHFGSFFYSLNGPSGLWTRKGKDKVLSLLVKLMY